MTKCISDLSGTSLTVLAEKYLLFLGDVAEPEFAKTAFGLRDWAPERCVGECLFPGATVTTGLPRMTPAEAFANGARAIVIGVAAIGGRLQANWVPMLVHALEAGLDIVSGTHTLLTSVPELVDAASGRGRRLIDIRRPPANLPIATGRKRAGKRLLTVGTDCALGKKYTALCIARAFRQRGICADFRATGQTGILIAGRGIPIDAVVADFVAGAAEALSPDADPGHWDVIEGQGSVFHPAYAGVSLGLLHGSQPDIVVVCHAVGRLHVLGYPDYPVPSLKETIEMHLALARRVNPEARCAGVSLNTSSLPPDDAGVALRTAAAELQLPVADPLRPELGFQGLIDSCLRGFPAASS